jgi:HK97 gp10 family phage protein
MADGVEFKLEGLEEVMGKLKELPIDMRKKGGRFALRKAAQVVRDSARDNAKTIDDPATSEEISKNIVEKWSGRYFSRTGGDMKFRVGVLGGAKGYAKASGELKGTGKANPGGDTFYWRFVEFGTSKMPAQPFIRRAMTENINKATSTFISEYGKALDRALKRAKKVT